jgi:hypothetical protein
MKKLAAAFLALALSFAPGCAVKKKEAAEIASGAQSNSIRFNGYKLTARVKSGVEDAEKFSYDCRNWWPKAAANKMKLVSGDHMSKIGDKCVYEYREMGVSMPSQVIMVHYQPQKEAWFLNITQSPLNLSGGVVISITRYSFKQIDNDLTLVTVRDEARETSPVLAKLMERFKINEEMSNWTDLSMAELQAHFDPGLDVNALVAGGNRGDNYELFFTAGQQTLKVNASPKKVADYLNDQKNWDRVNKKYGVEINTCLAAVQAGPCMITLKPFGASYTGNAFPVIIDPEKYLLTYWVGQIIVQMEMSLKPEMKVTQLNFKYLYEVLPATTPEGAEMLMGAGQIPQFVNGILTEIKNGAEGNP